MPAIPFVSLYFRKRGLRKTARAEKTSGRAGIRTISRQAQQERRKTNMTENAREDGEEDDFLIFGGLENIVTGDENRNGDDDSDGFRSGNANFETDIFETAGEAGEQEAAESEQQEPEEPESEQPGPLVSSIPGRPISREDVIEHLKKRVRCRLSKENMQAFES